MTQTVATPAKTEVPAFGPTVPDRMTQTVPTPIKTEVPTFVPVVPDRQELIDRFNRAVRRPDLFGGEDVLRGLLDEIAAAEGDPGRTVWLPDGNARMSLAHEFQRRFPDPGINVVASQLGQDAHRRGWLRLDRTLTRTEYQDLVKSVQDWTAAADRGLHEVLATYGTASVVFGSPDPRQPKTLGYGAQDTSGPLVLFHLGADESSPTEPVLLGVLIDNNDFSNWGELTPLGERR